MPWENVRDFSTITGLVILNSRWWFDGCFMIVNFAMQLQRELCISIKLHFIFLLLSDVNVLYISWARIYFVNLTKVGIIIVSKHYPIDQRLCDFEYPSSYLINLWFSDTMLNKLQNIVFPGSTFWFQEEICAILLLVRTCSGYGLNWQARQLLTYLTVVFVNKCRLWIIAAVSWDCVCVYSARLNYNKIIAINSSPLSK